MEPNAYKSGRHWCRGSVAVGTFARESEKERNRKRERAREREREKEGGKERRKYFVLSTFNRIPGP
jgi:hypothetical protein